MNPPPILPRIAGALERLAIPYMLSGSFASSHHGAPRTTQDIDIVVNPSLAQLDELLTALEGPDVYLDRDVAHEELARRGQFNVIEMSSGWKVDVIFAKRRAFSRTELERRVRATILGTDLFVASPEDAILSKLEWAKLGGSDRQLADVSGIVKTQGTSLDRAYVEEWLDDLGVRGLWLRVLAAL